MYDGSHLNLEENIRRTKEVVKLAHLKNVSVEAELGSLGLGSYSNEEGAEEVYTKPEEAQKIARVSVN